jgi:hypothetical protein
MLWCRWHLFRGRAGWGRRGVASVREQVCLVCGPRRPQLTRIPLDGALKGLATLKALAFALAAAVVATSVGAQAGPPAYVTTGIFIGAIEEGARIFTPARLLPFDHPEALGHQFPTALQLHRGEDRLLLLLGRHAGLGLRATLQRYPTEPDTLWPYAPFQAPPVDTFQSVVPILRPASAAPLAGLRAVAYLDRFPVAFIVDTRGLTLAERHMQQATTMGLDITRAQFTDALGVAARMVPASGPALLVYQR